MAVTYGTRLRIVAVLSAAATAATLGLTANPAQAAPAEGRVIGAGAPDAVKDSYIVILNERSGTKSASSEGRRLVTSYGGEVSHTYRAALNGYAANLSGTEAKRLAADPAVSQVIQDTTVKATATQANPPSWGLDRIDQANLPLNASYTYPDSAGAGVTAYVIDTGVRITHTDFGGRASYGYDAIDNDFVADDGNGHGTHVAGTVAGTRYGVAKNAKVVGVRVLNNAGSGTTAQVVAGIDWVTANAVKPAVANMSLGGGANTAIDTAVRNSIASGITYAVAAGNNGLDAANYSPARVTEAITVGATTSTDARASYSNTGTRLDLFAPGSAITSAWRTSDTASSSISGTSMASPHVAGAAAIYLGNHTTSTPAQVSSALVAAATPGVVTNPGSGSANRLLRVIP